MVLITAAYKFPRTFANSLCVSTFQAQATVGYSGVETNDWEIAEHAPSTSTRSVSVTGERKAEC